MREIGEKDNQGNDIKPRSVEHHSGYPHIAMIITDISQVPWQYT